MDTVNLYPRPAPESNHVPPSHADTVSPRGMKDISVHPDRRSLLGHNPIQINTEVPFVETHGAFCVIQYKNENRATLR